MKVIPSLLVFIFLFINLFAQTKDTVGIHVQNSSPKGKDTLQVRDTLKQASGSYVDSSKVKKIERIIPVYRQPLTPQTEYSGLISQHEILYNVYRYTGDFFKNSPLAFERNLGVTGQPDEILIYGLGFNQVSYFRNGYLINNRLNNSFDLNNIQSEIIDSVEIIPSTRGFLYGNFNNNASVNFITKYKFVPDTTRGAYSKVRFCQAPTEEAMIDFIYSSNFSRKLNVTLDVTNRTTNLRFIQTGNGNIDAYGMWQGTARFRYYLSNDFNIIGSYKYLKSNTRLFGGINVDSTISRNNLTNFNDFYSANTIITKYIDRYQKVTDHKYNLDLIGNTTENIKSEYSLYYSFDQVEFRQNESKNEKVPFIFDNNKYNLYGVKTRQTFDNNILNVDASAGYETIDYDADVIKQKDKVSTSFVSGIASFNLPEKAVIPSFFIKYLSYNKSSLLGYGADMSVNLIPNTQFYAGLSHYNRPLNILENFYLDKFSVNRLPDTKLRQTTSLEFGSKYKSDFLFTDFSWFYRQVKNDLLPIMANDTLTSLSYNDTKTLGIGLKLNLNFWKINIETNSAYYITKQNNLTNYRLPQFTFNGGIYYRNILFNSNLDLKAGIRGTYIGRQDFVAYDFERSISGASVLQNISPEAIDDPFSTVNSSYNVDLVLLGEIRKVALVFITLENLFNSNYYIVPFYPMYPRQVVFGISWSFLN